jgi:hypothetical protein
MSFLATLNPVRLAAGQPEVEVSQKELDELYQRSPLSLSDDEFAAAYDVQIRRVAESFRVSFDEAAESLRAQEQLVGVAAYLRALEPAFGGGLARVGTGSHSARQYCV